MVDQSFLRRHIGAMVGTRGLGAEEIEYKRYPGAGWADIRAIVEREPTDEVGSRIPRAVHVMVSKDDLAEDDGLSAVVKVDRDEIRLDGEVIYRVVDIVGGKEKSDGYYMLRAIR